MPRYHKDHVPAYRRHGATGQAVVTLNGRDHYLGRHGTQASREAYDRLVSEWLADDPHLPVPEHGTCGTAINELLACYRRHAKSYYCKDGRPTSKPDYLRHSLRPVKRLYGSALAATFSDDGLPFAATGGHNGRTEAWVAYVLEATAASLLLSGSALLMNRTRGGPFE